MICFYLSKTKCFDITEIKQDSQSDLFQPLFNENFIKIDIFCRNILTLMKQHVTMKQGPIYSGFVCFNFKKRKKKNMQRAGCNDTADFSGKLLQVPGRASN